MPEEVRNLLHSSMSWFMSVSELGCPRQGSGAGAPERPGFGAEHHGSSCGGAAQHLCMLTQLLTYPTLLPLLPRAGPRMHKGPWTGGCSTELSPQHLWSLLPCTQWMLHDCLTTKADKEGQHLPVLCHPLKQNVGEPHLSPTTTDCGFRNQGCPQAGFGQDACGPPPPPTNSTSGAWTRPEDLDWANDGSQHGNARGGWSANKKLKENTFFLQALIPMVGSLRLSSSVHVLYIGTYSQVRPLLSYPRREPLRWQPR